MRSIDESFYNSTQWRATREAYKREHPLCEQCLREGRTTPAEHIHHIKWLNKTNVKNPSIAYGFNNLMSLCHACHNKIHGGDNEKRYKVLPNGEIVTLPPSED